MNMSIKTIALALLGSLLLMPALGYSQTLMIRCDNCDYNLAHYQAKQLAEPGVELELLMHNPASAESWRFHTFVVIDNPNCVVNRPGSPNEKASTQRNNACAGTPFANLTPQSTDEIALVSAYREAYLQTNATMKSVIRVTAEGAGLYGPGPVTGGTDHSAADVRNDPQLRDRLTGGLSYWLTRFQSTAAFTDNKLVNLLQVSMAVGNVALLGADGTVLVIQIAFEDGAVLEIQYDGNSQYGKIIEARDGEGRTVLAPDNQAQFDRFQQQYDDRQLETWLNNARTLGVPITTIAAPVPYGGGDTVTCKFDGETLTCTRHQN